MKFFQQIMTSGLHVTPFCSMTWKKINVFSGNYSSRAGKQSVDILSRRWTWVSPQVPGISQLKGTCHASSTVCLTNRVLSCGPLSFSYEHYHICINQAVDEKYIWRPINSYYLSYALKGHFYHSSILNTEISLNKEDSSSGIPCF